MKVRFKVTLVMAAAALAMFFLASVPANAQVPSLPHQFYGTVKINNVDAPIGTVIEARVTGALNGTFNPITTTELGKYGSANPLAVVPRLLVQGEIVEGATIQFFVNGARANETAAWHAGQVTPLNLTAGLPPNPAPGVPAITTDSASGITATSASLFGTLASLGTAAIVNVSFDYGTTAGGPYPNLSGIQTTTISATFTIDITGLTPGTTYYFRARASAGASGTAFGVEKSFVTQAAAPAGGGGGGGAASPPAAGGTAGTGVTTTITLVGVTGVAPMLDSRGKTLNQTKLTSGDGKAVVNIPAGTQITDKSAQAISTLTVTPVTAPLVPPTWGSILLAYNFGPAGTQFNPPISLTISFDPAALPAGKQINLSIAFWDGAQWVKLDSTLDPAANTVTALVSHFTEFAIIIETPGAAAPPAVPSPPPASTPAPPPSPAPSPAPVQTPTATVAPPAPVSQAGVNLWLIGGIIGVVALLAVNAVLLIKKRR